MPPNRPRRKTAESPHQSPSNEPQAGLPEWLEHIRISVEENTPERRELIMRSINAVMSFGALSEDAAVKATEAESDLEVLLRALSSGEVLERLRSYEPLAPAFIRGIQARNRLLNENGGTLTAEEVAGLLGISRQAVGGRRSLGHLLGLPTTRGYRYPAWQFIESGVLPGLEDVLMALAPHDPWMQAAFFLGNNPRLNNRSPVELLKAGELSPVLKAAEAYGEQGAA